MRSRTFLALPLAALVSLLVAACGDDDSSTPDDNNQPFTGTIRIVDNAFSPASVTIAPGDSVTWRWEGSMSHTVTHGTSPTVPPDAQKLFDSPLQSSGTFGYRFTTAGTYSYFCRPHFPSMTGTVRVQ